MKTVKDVSEITGVSIRTLRYYDEIGLLNPTELTKAGYRLYDNKAVEKLQEIMFVRELEIPLTDIKKIRKDFWGYNIISKNNTNFPLKCSGQAEKCAKKLIHLIGQEI